MGFNKRYVTYLCDQSYNKICRADYTFLQYSKVISAIPQAYFVIQPQNPTYAQNSIALLDNIYNLIIEDGATEVFRGEVDQFDTPTKNTPLGLNLQESYGTLDHIGLYASGILQKFADLVVVPDTGSTVYKRSFPDGTTVATALRTLLNEAISQPNSPVASITLGTIEEPLDTAGNVITLSNQQALYGSSYLEWIKTLASIGYMDYYIDNKTVFNFVRRKGIDRSSTISMTLKKNFPGNNLTGVTFSVDRRKMANRIIAVGAQNGINQIVAESTDANNAKAFGRREKVILARSLDSASTIQQYANNYLKQVNQKLPLDAFQIYPTQNAQLFGGFDLGDTISLNIDWDIIQVSNRPMRAMGAVITVEPTEVERIYYSIQEATI